MWKANDLKLFEVFMLYLKNLKEQDEKYSVSVVYKIFVKLVEEYGVDENQIFITNFCIKKYGRFHFEFTLKFPAAFFTDLFAELVVEGLNRIVDPYDNIFLTTTRPTPDNDFLTVPEKQISSFNAEIVITP